MKVSPKARIDSSRVSGGSIGLGLASFFVQGCGAPVLGP